MKNLQDNIQFNNTVEIFDDVTGERIYYKKNAQTIANRNMLVNLYGGTNPTSALNLSLLVEYSVGAGSPTTTAITSADDSTTPPTGSSVTPWGYTKQTRIIQSAGLDSTTGAVIIRGRLYFPDGADISGVFIQDDANSSVILFSSSDSGNVPAGRSVRINYTIGII